MHVHACLLALHTGKPVKIAYNREESFFGHVHRHPAWMRYEHGANRDGELVYVRAEVLLDGGAYTSSSPAVISNAACFAAGPYRLRTAEIDARVVFSNDSPRSAKPRMGRTFTQSSERARLSTWW